MSPATKKVYQHLLSLADPKGAASTRRFFNQHTDPDEPFIGIPMPVLRKYVRDAHHLSLPEAISLLHIPEHEIRMFALLVLNDQFASGTAAEQRAIYRTYLDNTAWINNWDFVDTSAPQIIGGYLLDRSRKPLTRLAKSKNLWERRMAILATFPFIRNDDFADTLAISERFLHDPEDLIHKAVGWMLREVGKRDQKVEETFLNQHAAVMPRTMLRYAIERFPEKRRRHYLSM